MHLETFLKIIRDTGIECIICASQDVESIHKNIFNFQLLLYNTREIFFYKQVCLLKLFFISSFRYFSSKRFSRSFSPISIQLAGLMSFQKSFKGFMMKKNTQSLKNMTEENISLDSYHHQWVFWWCFWCSYSEDFEYLIYFWETTLKILLFLRLHFLEWYRFSPHSSVFRFPITLPLSSRKSLALTRWQGNYFSLICSKVPYFPIWYEEYFSHLSYGYTSVSERVFGYMLGFSRWGFHFSLWCFIQVWLSLFLTSKLHLRTESSKMLSWALRKKYDLREQISTW